MRTRLVFVCLLCCRHSSRVVTRPDVFLNCSSVLACVLLPCLLWVWRPGVGGDNVLEPRARQQVPSPWWEKQFKPLPLLHLVNVWD